MALDHANILVDRATYDSIVREQGGGHRLVRGYERAGRVETSRGLVDSHLCIGDSTSDGQRHDLTFDAQAGLTYYIDLEAPSQQPNYTLSVACQ